MKRYKSLFGLDSKSKNIWFIIFFIFFILYFSAIVFFQYTIKAGNLYFLFALLIPLLLVLPKISAEKNFNRKKTNSKKVFILVAGLTFLLFELWHLSVFPGSFSFDSIAQFNEAQNGQFNDWHPVIQTWLIFSIPIHIWNNPGFIIILQNLYFSLAVGYLFYVLYDENAGYTFLIFSGLFIMLNINTYRIMMYPWKDSAMSIFALVFFTHIIRIYKSNGAWLKKIKNIFSFVLFAFLTAMMRHNAILIVFPVFVILFVFFRTIRKRIFAMFFSLLILIFVLKLIIYPFAGVIKPGNRTIEFLGLPMAVLSNVYKYDKQALNPEEQEFMKNLASDEAYNEYATGDFNTLKWHQSFNSKFINQAGTANILTYTFDAFDNSPFYAWQAFLKLTGLVWQIDDNNNNWRIYSGIYDNDAGIGPQKAIISLGSYRGFIRKLSYIIFPLNLFNFIGVINLLLIFMATGRIGQTGLGRIFIILSPLCYNFGTMLLLSGPDFRFFHYNFLIFIPIVFILLSKDYEKIQSTIN